MAERKRQEKLSKGVSEQYRIAEIESFLEEKVESLTGKEPDIRIIETPKHVKSADYGIHLARISVGAGWENPTELASEMAKSISNDKPRFISSAESVGPFLNISLEADEFGRGVVDQILRMGADYGRENIGQGKVAVFDMSSPNIAKRMSYGHLRSTIIGDSLASIYRTEGFEVIRDNHIGDWGTQFGNLIVAIKEWGNEKSIFEAEDPVGELQSLYEKFYEEEEKQSEKIRRDAKKKIEKEGKEVIPGLNEAIERISKEIMERKNISRDEVEMDKVLEDALDGVLEDSPLTKKGREWFSKLEKGNKEARRIWKKSIEVSLEEFESIYSVLGVNFEETLGESFYEDKMAEVIEEVERGVGEISDGALIVDLTDKGLGVSIVRKSDGGTVYMTRDLATAIYRQDKMSADRALYVVGEDQKHYFEQLFEILSLMGHEIGDRSEHIYFGMVSLPEGKMSSRKGRVILLKEVINEGFERVAKLLDEKKPEKLRGNPELKSKVIRQIAVGALKWNDLMQHRKMPVKFEWDRALNLKGNSAPYVQYAAVRANSVLAKEGLTKDSVDTLEVETGGIYEKEAERALVRKLANYPNILKDAFNENDPSKIATYVYELTQRFNAFYNSTYVLDRENPNVMNSRLKLVAASSQVIENASNMLGIEVPEAM